MSFKRESQWAERNYLFFEGLIQKTKSEKKIKEFQKEADYWQEEYLKSSEKQECNIWEELGLNIRE